MFLKGTPLIGQRSLAQDNTKVVVGTDKIPLQEPIFKHFLPIEV